MANRELLEWLGITFADLLVYMAMAVHCVRSNRRCGLGGHRDRACHSCVLPRDETRPNVLRLHQRSEGRHLPRMRASCCRSGHRPLRLVQQIGCRRISRCT